MKAPKKIYIMPHTLANGFCRRWFEEPFKVECIEYVRKDAFIEKAEKYLTEKFIKDVSILCGGVVNINFDVAISNFLKYMKGDENN